MFIESGQGREILYTYIAFESMALHIQLPVQSVSFKFHNYIHPNNHLLVFFFIFINLTDQVITDEALSVKFQPVTWH